MTEANQLFGSAKLAAEEEVLRKELMLWAQAKLDEGARPVAIQTALMVAGDQMADCDFFGLQRRRGPLRSYKGQFDPS